MVTTFLDPKKTTLAGMPATNLQLGNSETV